MNVTSHKGAAPMDFSWIHISANINKVDLSDFNPKHVYLDTCAHEIHQKYIPHKHVCNCKINLKAHLFRFVAQLSSLVGSQGGRLLFRNTRYDII